MNGRLWAPATLIAGLWLTAGGARAMTARLDDSATLPGRSTAALHWLSAVPAGPRGMLAEARTSVRLILNTAPFAGRPARIYMSLAPQPLGPVEVDWTTRGALLPGSLQAGGRTLVFAGVAPARTLTDTLAVRVRLDGRRIEQPTDLRFHFEIETD